jgi:hypothetical protein
MRDVGSPALSQVFNYTVQPKEFVNCPLCGRDNRSVGESDRYGFYVGVSACVCGLTYLNPRMSSEQYAQFYAEGTYRRLVKALRPSDASGDQLMLLQRAYGSRIAKALKAARVKTAVDVLDAGGGDGSVIDGMTTCGFTSVTVLDPCGTEVERAQAKGYRTITGTLETLEGGPFGGIVCAETLDHLCDPMEALSRMRTACAGWLWVDFVEQSTWKIDHPLYWTIRGLESALKKTGWTPKGCFRWQGGGGFRTGVICG